MAQTMTPATMEAAIARSVREQIERIVDEEANAAAERVRVRVQDARAAIATRIASAFDYQAGLDRILITVKNIDGPPKAP